jgi:chemotaxis signal transduction protein/DNA-binding XRE family transcriptional regulator
VTDESLLLSEARRRAGISQRELARRAGTSQAAVARIERGRQSPSAATLRRLVAACGVDLEVTIPPADEAPRAPLDGRLVLCDIGGAAYAFPLAAVVEVVPYVAPRRLPGQPADAGVALVRGRVVATLDAALRLDVPAPEPPTRMVLLSARTGVHAVAVTAASDITELEPSRLSPPPAGAQASRCVSGLAEIDGDLVVVLDPDELCAPR